MANQKDKQVTNPSTGQKPTENDNFYIEWGKETKKNNIAFSNEILKQIISISSAILGLSVVFEDKTVIPQFKLFSLLAILISLIIAFLGLLPYEDKILLNAPADIELHKVNALKNKRYFLWTSATFLVIGFMIILAQFSIKLL